MILIPEIETVMILVPRTASGAFKEAIVAQYPLAWMPYRHGEVELIPQGYEKWRKVGICRHPVRRLWSLFKYCQTLPTWKDADRRERVIKSVTDITFNDWLINNEEVFVSANLPFYMAKYQLPENLKSQFLYLRPDLNTQVWPFTNIVGLADDLGIELGRINETPHEPVPLLTGEAQAFTDKIFEWDYDYVAAH